MKFSLFAISAVALCLLQQSQASPLGDGGNLLAPVTNILGGKKAPVQGATVDNTVVGGEGKGSVAAPADGEREINDPAGQDKGDNSTEAKRDTLLGLDGILGGLLDTVNGLLEGITGSSGLLDISKLLDLDDPLGGLVGTVRSLFEKGSLVGGLLETVTDLLSDLLDLLESLGLGDIVDLTGLEDLVADLVEAIGDVSKRSVTPDVAAGTLKKIDLGAVKGLLEKIQGLLKGTGLEGILKPVLDIVNSLLGGVVNGEGTKAGVLRRALIKRAIERRAAL